MKENETGRNIKGLAFIIAILGVCGCFAIALPIYVRTGDILVALAEVIPYLIGILISYVMMHGFGELLIVLQKIADKD